MKIRSCEIKDIASICAIYNYYVDNTIVTFEEVPVAEEEMARRVSSCMASFPWLVCEVGDRIVGYAYATKWQGRVGYRYSVEVTIYIRQGEAGRGYGRSLYAELMSLLSDKYHAAVAGISLPNAGSVALHEKFGFEKVAHFREVGRKFDRWIDVGYWQKVLTRP